MKDLITRHLSYLLLTLTFLALLGGCQHRHIAYDSAVWKAGGDVRWYMVRDLQRQSFWSAGANQAVILRELGPPEVKRRPWEYAGPTAEIIWGYELGAHSGFQMDMDYFAVSFDKDGNVLKTWVYQS